MVVHLPISQLVLTGLDRSENSVDLVGLRDLLEALVCSHVLGIDLYPKGLPNDDK